MARVLEEGKSIFIPFKDGFSITDSQLHLRMYKTPEQFKRYFPPHTGYDALYEYAPVVHGEWVWDVETHGDPMYGVDEDFGYRCSECKVWADEYGVDGDIYEEPPTHILHFCPNCGADMRGET